MGNTIIPEVYRAERAKNFEQKTISNTVAGDIAKITKGAFNDLIEKVSRTDAVVNNGTGKALEVDITNYQTSKEFINIDEFLVVAEPSEFVKNAYSIIDLEKESLDAANEAILLEFDKKVLTDALTQTTLTVPTSAITNETEALQASLEIQSALAGYAPKLERIAIVMDNSMFIHFLKAGATRLTQFGDRVLETGTLYSFLGMELYVVRAGQIPAGEILATVKGSVNVYRDDLKFDKRQGTPTVNTKVSLWDVDVAMVYMKVKIWADDLKKVVKLA